MSAHPRYHCLRLPVEQPGQIVRFQHRLPVDLSHCTGFRIGIANLYLPMEGYGLMGALAVEFNSKKTLAVNAPVGYENTFYEIPCFQELNIPLEVNQLLSGYYRDSGLVRAYRDSNGAFCNFSPYEVVVYFRCQTSVACSTKSYHV